jgi:hypothetical protein
MGWFSGPDATYEHTPWMSHIHQFLPRVLMEIDCEGMEDWMGPSWLGLSFGRTLRSLQDLTPL